MSRPLYASGSRQRRLNVLSARIQRQQNQDKRILSRSVVGRAVDVPAAEEVNKVLSVSRLAGTRYEAIGILALVHLHKLDLRENIGIRYENTTQAEGIVSGVARKSPPGLVINRGELELNPEPLASARNGRPKFWMVANVASARRLNDDGNRFDVSKEQKRLSEHFTKNTVRHSHLLWLGALSAASLDLAREALDVLEDALPTRLLTGQLELISPPRAARPS